MPTKSAEAPELIKRRKNKTPYKVERSERRFLIRDTEIPFRTNPPRLLFEWALSNKIEFIGIFFKYS
ncbi:hypothetical protein GL2_14830 [Microbulbifer sp. GL-2]|nr:hypothetical protein GL2_14830 [Microbulbifer sp. GL-2]